MNRLAKKPEPPEAQVHRSGSERAAAGTIESQIPVSLRAAACGLNQLTTIVSSVRFPVTVAHDPRREREADPMTRERIIAGICLLITLGLMWFVDHPDKVAGTVVLGIVFCIFLLVARLKGRSGSKMTRMIRKPPDRE